MDDLPKMLRLEELPLLLETQLTQSTGPAISPLYTPTVISADYLSLQPVKTWDRIVDDLRWLEAYMAHYNHLILPERPLNYSGRLVSPLKFSRIESLNDQVEFAPLVSKIQLPERQQQLSIVRGLLIGEKLRHLEIRILEDRVGNPFRTTGKEKLEFYAILQNWLSPDDQMTLAIFGKSPIEDVFFRSEGLSKKSVRILIFDSEFDGDAMELLTNPEIIKSRYMHAKMQKYPTLLEDTIPTAGACILYLIRVLKGPLLHKPGDENKTITLSQLVLDAQIDVKMLVDLMGFTLNEDGTQLIPPNLEVATRLKLEFTRRIFELIWKARSLNLEGNYSFLRYLWLSLNVIRCAGDLDSSQAVHYFSEDPDLPPSLFVALLAYPFYQDELLIKCFDLSTTSDPSNRLYYVDAMKNLANIRGGRGRLNAWVQQMTAKGQFTGLYEYIDSLAALGVAVDEKDLPNIEDSLIIASYELQVAQDPRNYSFYYKQLELIASVRPSIRHFLTKEIPPVLLAEEMLAISEVTEDEVVITAYEYKLDDLMQQNMLNADAAEIRATHRALLSIAVHRKLFCLLDYVEKKLPQLCIPFEGDTKTAYNILGVDSHEPDFMLVLKFQEILINTDDTRPLRAALRRIAEVRDLVVLNQFLASGQIDSLVLPLDLWPAGLDNIGNTCYLNSLLQYYFCLEPLRKEILAFDHHNVKIGNEIASVRKIGGRRVDPIEVERLNQFIYHLADLFYQLIHANRRCVQPLKQLAYLAFLPLLTPVDFDFKKKEGSGLVDDLVDENLMTECKSESNSDYEDDTSLTGSSYIVDTDERVSEIKSKDSALKVTPPEAKVEVEDLPQSQNPQSFNESLTDEQPGRALLPISSDQIELTIEVGRQQDVTECIENVTFQIETALPPILLDTDQEQNDLIKRLFGGKTNQTITPLDATKSPRILTERFFSLIINISEHPKDIYDSLDTYFSEDLVELDGGKCRKLVTILELPDVLQFHVQRVMFDRERLVAYKALDPIPFGEHIYLDRYLDSDDAQMIARRAEVFTWKQKISFLRDERSKITMPNPSTKLLILDSLKGVKSYMTKLSSQEHSTKGALNSSPNTMINESYTVEDDDSSDIEMQECDSKEEHLRGVDTEQLSSLTVSESTINFIDRAIEELEMKLKEIDAEILDLQSKVSVQFDDYNKVGYSVFAIFIHRGEALYGHYWVYIKDFERDMWRKYNDEVVTRVPELEVFDFSEGNTATPYYIVYVKDGCKDIVKPLKRDIIN
ncbi:hypothetical protein JNB11_04090 [Kocuria palustris]|nr:hypothetical protein [Kocuria palustris]